MSYQPFHAARFAAVTFAMILVGCADPTHDMAGPPAASRQPSATAPAGAREFAATLYVKGMSCPLCANNIDKQLRAVPGVERVSIDLGAGVVVARLIPLNPPTRGQLEKAISESGFTLDRIEMPLP